MSERSVTHAAFVIERTYDAPPSRVFAAWSSAEAKAHWFVGPDEWEASPHELDFRVGGREHLSGGPKGGPVHVFDAVYHDIVPDRRIVTTYDMHADDTHTSTSVATVELTPEGSGTRLVLTEQGAFLDGHDKPEWREQGTRDLLDSLGRALEGQTATAP
jgi:uncharacterized protein YndB with AHSA1/START domain